MKSNIKRIVVKIGSSSLSHENGHLNLRSIDRVARVLSDLSGAGMDVILVSSGAVSAGRAKLGFTHKPDTIEEKQALAAATPLGRLGTPQDVADAVLYLVRASFLTGSVLRVDGGFLPFGI